MNKSLMEQANLKYGALPVDLNTAAVTGARIGLANANRVAIIVIMNTSTAAVLEATLRQHTAASAGTSADLVSANPYYYKAGAATSFTKVSPTVAAALKDLSVLFAADGGLVVFDVAAEDLTEGYTHISLDVADSTAAKLAAILYVAHDCRKDSPYDQAI